MLNDLRASLMAAFVLSAFFTCGHASATTLTGSGGHLALPTSPGVVPTFVSPTYAAGPTFPGTWNAPANPAWIGTFSGTGALPSTTAGAGTTRYDFTGLSAGYLPSSTFFVFGDVDAGSGGSEQFYFRAFDTTAAHALITTPWLSEPVATWGTGATSLAAMPGWAWNSSPGVYKIDGSTASFAGNPNLVFALLSEVPIGYLEVKKISTNYGLALAAPTFPVPEPSTLLLFGTGLLGLFRNGWRRQWAAD
jgi:hypothetical protein